MNCPIQTQENPELLLAYSAGKLDAQHRAMVQAHLEACADCREFAGGQRKVWEALDAWEAAPVSLDFDRRLYERIEKEVSWWDLLMRPFRPLMLRQGLPVAATAALVLAAGLLLQRPVTVAPKAAPQSAQVESLAPEQVESALDEMEMMREFNRLVRVDAADPKL